MSGPLGTLEDAAKQQASTIHEQALKLQQLQGLLDFALKQKAEEDKKKLFNLVEEGDSDGLAEALEKRKEVVDKFELELEQSHRTLLWPRARGPAGAAPPADKAWERRAAQLQERAANYERLQAEGDEFGSEKTAENQSEFDRSLSVKTAEN